MPYQGITRGSKTSPSKLPTWRPTCKWDWAHTQRASPPADNDLGVSQVCRSGAGLGRSRRASACKCHNSARRSRADRASQGQGRGRLGASRCGPKPLVAPISPPPRASYRTPCCVMQLTHKWPRECTRHRPDAWSGPRPCTAPANWSQQQCSGPAKSALKSGIWAAPTGSTSEGAPIAGKGGGATTSGVDGASGAIASEPERKRMCARGRSRAQCYAC